MEKESNNIFAGKGGIFASVSVVVAVLVVLMLLLASRFNRTVYRERQQLLDMVSASAARAFNSTADAQWGVYNLAFSLVSKAMESSKDVSHCLFEVNMQHDFGTNYYFLVDEDGKYYSSDGVYGKLREFSNFEKTAADRVEYLSTLPHMDPSRTYLIFRGRFDEPVRVNTDNGPKYLIYFAYAQDLSDFMAAVGTMVESSPNVLIYDSKGAVLYQEYGIGQLLDGANVYQKVDRCRMPFGETPEEVKSACRNGKTTVVDIRIDGNDYYFCSSPLSISDWSLALVIKPGNIDSTLSDGIWTLVVLIALIVLLLGAVLIAFAVTGNNKRQEERLEESRRFAEAMAETSRAKTVFLSNMSHDIRTPINGIMGVTTIARGAVNDPGKVTDCLDKIDTASGHLLSLINDVLDMSRIESGKTRIASEPCDLRTVCSNCSGIIQDQIAGRNIRFTTEMELPHPMVFADQVHLRRIFINILGNAVKFTRDGGRILFRCKETACYEDHVNCHFEFKDTGIGMSKSFLGRIFESFSQEENRERSNYSGTGLGMAITKQLLDLMGGTIEVESELGKGTSFYVDLSFKRDLLEQSAVEDKAPEDNDITGLRILLVEDNELNMEIAESLLTARGAIVDKAWDGLEALDKFTARDIGTYDAILMDIMMPRMDGLEAARAIRALKREDAAEVPIVAMTANAFEDDVRATLEAGMNAHLSKPIDMDEVVRTVASLAHKNRDL